MGELGREALQETLDRRLVGCGRGSDLRLCRERAGFGSGRGCVRYRLRREERAQLAQHSGRGAPYPLAFDRVYAVTDQALADGALFELDGRVGQERLDRKSKRLKSS